MLCLQEHLKTERKRVSREQREAEKQRQFELAVQEYGKDIFAFYYDLSFEETLRRHETKPNKADFGEQDMNSVLCLEQKNLNIRGNTMLENIPSQSAMQMPREKIDTYMGNNENFYISRI